MSEVEVRDVPEKSRYEAVVDGEVAGFAVYSVSALVITFVHTEVDDAYEGKGIGSTLARAALDDVRRRNTEGDWSDSPHRVKPSCPFIHSWIDRHPDYQELLG